MFSSDNPLSIKNIIAGIIITVIGGVIVAYIIQDARFAASRVTPTYYQLDITFTVVELESTAQASLTTQTSSQSQRTYETPEAQLKVQPSLPTFTPKPRIYKFSACKQLCDGTNDTRVFPARTEKIYAQWFYENIPVGAHYIRSWAMEGREWVRYDCVWSGPESGYNSVTLREPDGLHSGTWEVTIFVNDNILLQEQLTVKGDWDYWYPVGVIHSCFGTVPDQSDQP